MKTNNIAIPYACIAAGIGIIATAPSGCDSTPNVPAIDLQQGPIESGQRFSVSMDSKFTDVMAYGGQRGIYIIKDNQTKSEYVGISGIGISELGSHGNDNTRDER